VIPAFAAETRLEETAMFAAVIVVPLEATKNGAFSVSCVEVPVSVGVFTSVARSEATASNDALSVPMVPCSVAAVGEE
jgi:hypothetical protein